MKNKHLIGHSFSLTVAGLIYLLFRSTNIRMFSWLKNIGIGEFVMTLRHQSHSDYPEWILFSLPDGLWIFSYISLILLIWGNRLDIENIAWILIIPFLAIGSEIFQFFALLPGTFDIIDLLFYSLGSILPFLIYINSVKIKFKKS